MTGRNLSSVSDEWWCAGNTLAKYSNYLTNPTAAPTWSVTLPYLPVTDDNIKTFCVEGDYVFLIAAKLGKITVRLRSTGNIVGTIMPDASTDFKSGWADINGAISAHKRPNGEYLIFAEENGYGKIMMYRWCPSGNCTETSNTLTANTNYLNFTAAAGAQSLSITSNINWTISGVPAWLTVSSTSGTGNKNITLNASANVGAANRTATITVSGSGISKLITVNQIFDDKQTPSAVIGLASSLITPYSFDLSWNNSTDNVMVVGYQIIKDGVLFTTATGTSVNISGLTPNTKYAMTVKAIDAAGNVSTSGTINVSTSVLTYPYITARGDNGPYYASKAAAFDGNNGTKWYDFSRTSWIQIQDATAVVYNKYEFVSCGAEPKRFPSDWTVEASNNGVYWKVLSTKINQNDNGSSSLFYFSNTTAYTYYRVNITENNGENAIELCDIKFSNGAITDTEAPSVPTGITPSFITPTNLNLSWNESLDNVGGITYEVFIGSVSIGTTKSTNMPITGLTCNTINALTIRAKDLGGNLSPMSAPVNVKTGDCTLSNTDIEIIERLAIHPNPAKNELFITGNIAENATYEITSVDGKILQTEALRSGSISIHSLKAGFYLIKIKTEACNRVQRFVKE